MRFHPKHLLALLLAFGAFAVTTSCQAPEAGLQSLLPGVRTDPPVAGKNKVALIFQDQTAQDGEFETEILEGARAGLADRGYELLPFEEGADFKLWATLRLFQEVKSERERNSALISLGAIAGGAATAAAVNQLGGNPLSQVGAGLLGGGFFAWIVDKLTLVKTYVMVVDVQLGSKRANEIRYTEEINSNKQLGSSTAIGLSGPGGAISGDFGQTKDEVIRRGETERLSFFAELEQRLVATAKGSRLNKEEALKLLIPKISVGIRNQLPRYGN